MNKARRSAQDREELLKTRMKRVTAGVLAAAAVVEMVSIAFLRFDDKKK